ncbi:MAG: pyruvate kinase [Chitinophagales bacterium]
MPLKVAVNKAKIIATYGPAIETKDKLIEIIQAGVDVIRFNFSHGDYAFHQNGFNLVKEINKEHKLNIAILSDLQGPKIRIGKVDGELVLKKKELVEITDKECVSTKDTLFVSYEKLYKDVTIGERILINDGNIELKVVSVNDKKIQAEVIYGGILTSNKGVNLPETSLSAPSLTPKDLKDLDFALKEGTNWVALSFVRKASDIKKVISIIGEERHSYTKVISKIEKPEAIENIDSIIAATDAIMIARGDLGVEVPPEKVPLLQKDIIDKCIINAKPVIVATQMMESMIKNPVATRAEINDVANAVLDGTDAVMLSGETSIGKYPVRVVQTMQQILSNIEDAELIYNKQLVANPESETFLSDAICYNACKIAKEISAKAIIGMTMSGYTAFKISSYRPKAKIFIFTENKKLLPTLNLFWGIRAFYYNSEVGTNETIDDVIQLLKTNKLVKRTDLIVNTAAMPLKSKGKTNALKVSLVE